MRFVHDALLLSPTDLSTFVSCRHKTGLDLAAARGIIQRPRFEDPYAAILQRRGDEHERAYVEALRAAGLRVVDVRGEEDGARVTPAAGGVEPAPGVSATGRIDDRLARQTADTLAAMRFGADVIVQARLADGDLAGYADVLRRVERPSALGGWSYEAHDTKLARETRGGAILQLTAYSDLLARMQGAVPDRFHVVTPDPDQPVHSFRVADFQAYYRMVSAALRAAVASGHERLIELHYPEPVEHCGVCVWEPRCTARRRADDHLSFVAGAGRLHRDELTKQGHPTLAAAAAMPVPVPFRPSRGARETYDRLGHQARVQHQQRTEGRPVVERLPLAEGEGLFRLPAPSPGDVFLDLEGARFAREGGREFLFGLWSLDDDAAGGGLPFPRYRCWWATTDAEERQAFEEVMDLIAAHVARDPGMHVYHYNHYEPTAFKKLVGRYVTRGEALDRLLRAERFVDLYPIVRQAVRCGVESYSIKQLERYTGYLRRVTLGSASQPLLAVELALEAQAPDAITRQIRDAVEGYNEDDCRSAEALRDWLERLRKEAIEGGADIARPAASDGAPSPEVGERQKRAEQLRARLLAGLPPEAADASHADHPRWLLAYLVDWHRREENADWWEFFRLKEMPVEDLYDEKDAIAGLRLVERVEERRGKHGRLTGSVVDRYEYSSQEVGLSDGDKLNARDGEKFGEVVAHDRIARRIDILKGTKRAAQHVDDVFAFEVFGTKEHQESVMRMAERVLAGDEGECGVGLLHRRVPRLRAGAFAAGTSEPATRFAVRIATDLDRTTLAVQGPPGAGKTHVGAEMIRALVAAGRKVGVTANSHKVIRNLLDKVAAQAAAASEAVRVAAKVSDDPAAPSGAVREIKDAKQALAALKDDVDVLGGTTWLWCTEAASKAVDVLFVDEAGQMSLANVLAVSQAAGSVVLLGDPQQLQQPQKASHPDGVGVSALDHVLGGAETMPEERGIFLPTTRRMAPAITRFTSEVFYEGKLQSQPGLERQVLAGAGRFDGAGLWLVPVAHDGNQNASDEEVEAVAALVDELLAPGATWVDEHAAAQALTGGDLRVVAPFNAQVNRLLERLTPRGILVGTVDKFQGQTAAVVIYSMTTSRPEDAPRGMEFLYSLNRLNVATSRARCAAIVVCSPRLLEPECRTPRQMQLANALCRFREMAGA